MSRIEPLTPPFDHPTAELLKTMMPAGVDVPPLAIFRLLARLPKLGCRLAGVGGAILTSTTLPLSLRELAILRTTARLGAEYEWGVHVTWLARRAGLNNDQVTNTCARALDPKQWSAVQAAVLRAVDQLVDSSSIDDAGYAALREHLDEDAILELIVAVGFYHLISFVARGAELTSEPWAARFEPRRPEADEGQPCREPARRLANPTM